MTVYDIYGNTGRVYDIYGNEVAGGDSVGYVTEPQYITVNGNPYRLVWHDEFDGDDLDSEREQYLARYARDAEAARGSPG